MARPRKSTKDEWLDQFSGLGHRNTREPDLIRANRRAEESAS